MTLQKLTDTLQAWCHQGHAQDNVEFVVEDWVYASAHPRIEASPQTKNTVWLCIDGNDDQN